MVLRKIFFPDVPKVRQMWFFSFTIQILNFRTIYSIFLSRPPRTAFIHASAVQAPPVTLVRAVNREISIRRPHGWTYRVRRGLDQAAWSCPCLDPQSSTSGDSHSVGDSNLGSKLVWTKDVTMGIAGPIT